MKTIKIILALILFSGCAAYNVRQEKEPQFSYPVFLANGNSFAAFKAEAESKDGGSYNALLTLRRARNNGIEIKLSGDFGYVFLDADFKDGKFVYKREFWAACPEGAQNFFEEIIKALTVPPSGFINSYEGRRRAVTNFKIEPYTVRYYFKKGFNFPYKMEQIKFIVNKTFEYDAYRMYGKNILPSSIEVTAGFSLAKARLKLLAAK